MKRFLSLIVLLGLVAMFAGCSDNSGGGGGGTTNPPASTPPGTNAPAAK